MSEEEKTIELPEYDPKEYDLGELPDHVLETIYEQYGEQVNVEWPSPKTDGKWVLKNDGYAGRVLLDDGWTLVLEPKVSLSNIFGMLEYAYDLESAEFLEGVYDADSIEGFFDRVASILAKNVERRSNQGFHKEYVEKQEESSFVRGKIDLQKTVREPWKPEVHQTYRDLTADIEDNQILLWTLWKVLSSGLLREETRKQVRRAVRSLREIATLQEFTANDCTGRTYRRLNSDYEFMHSLCYLLLDNSGPTREMGEQEMRPFSVDMPRLYERFVARWLKEHVPQSYEVQSQKTVTIHESPSIQFDIDLVIKYNGNVVAVADTKYKERTRPDTDDIAQVVAYAEYYGTENAFLIYPEDLQTDFDVAVGDVHVQDLQFRLGGDLEANGSTFRSDILRAIRRPMSGQADLDSFADVFSA
ncbi:McrC family protein [Haloferax larsenii]|uniref:McrC family protein n=1 Tax=Haloferax larsenii TaxID=302484 RepID=A0ABY5RF51_HALLR|nr:McrC family protein [Haloferax larsenii]UVE49653.1 McrC family protein [Haloferax larsenii]